MERLDTLDRIDSSYMVITPKGVVPVTKGGKPVIPDNWKPSSPGSNGTVTPPPGSRDPSIAAGKGTFDNPESKPSLAKDHAVDYDVHDMTDEEANKAVNTMFNKLIFIALGVADLFFWNTVLNILGEVEEAFKEEMSWLTTLLNALNNVCTISAAIYVIKSGGCNAVITTAAGALLSVACIMTAITFQLLNGKIAGGVLLIVSNMVGGLCCGLYQTGAVGLASVLGDGSITGYFSTGQGVTGVLTFVIWLIVKDIAKLDTEIAMWIQMAIGVVITIAASAGFWILAQKPLIKTRANEVRAQLKADAKDPNRPRFFTIVKQAWMPNLALFWNMFMTLGMFPNIAPFCWKVKEFSDGTLDDNKSTLWLNMVIGAFQVGDCVGRFVPNLLPWTRINSTSCLIVAFVRTAFPVLAICMFAMRESVDFFSNEWLQIVLMFVMAVSNGWLVTNAFMRIPLDITVPEYRSRGGVIGCIVLLFGIAAGLWVSSQGITRIVNSIQGF